MNRSLRWIGTMLAVAACAAPAEEGLQSDQQKFSYAIGLQVTQSILRQGVAIDADAFSLAVQDAVAGSQPRLKGDEMARIMEQQQKQATGRLREMAKQNATKGRSFLDKNRQRPDVKVLESGLQYRVVRAGTGPRPKADSMVTVNYVGTLIDGREFDSSARHNEPAKFQVNGVIPGWSEALQLMPVGSKWQLFVPPELAYGARGAGAVIGPNETLVFDVELLSIN
ncbi:MAG: FKBP-type peptidyl-prolyl cis-trans isomerase [Gammaproteobacteria bacterium]